MMVREIKFIELEKLLLEVGFVAMQTVGSQKVYQHPPSDTLVVLPGYDRQSSVRQVHLVAVRRILSENGLMESDRFDSFIDRVAS
ncbi:type II toxin-antitoxin system HicA family toxin [Calothrix sp. 336/3]|uniref:type II toxin-antitoxin system HicA family toxin n=1 Tax=Calothrix sp. 336/3 TaxID=1337936 RepID=UPI001EDF162C|nr:type II toxin-antitoxin system HicA family toxin [Calothrix sp. 336/3]